MSDYYSPLRDNGRRYWQRVAERCEAEERDRAEWISDLKLRYGLVCAGDLTYPDSRAADYWPADVDAGNYRVVSDHRLEIPLSWPPGCRCVLLDGEQVSLGGPCPVHTASTDGACLPSSPTASPPS